MCSRRRTPKRQARAQNPIKPESKLLLGHLSSTYDLSDDHQLFLETRHVPAALASHVPFALALLSMPLSLLFDPDSFYFGVLPVIGEVVARFDVPIAQVAQAALLGQMTTGFPVSPLTPATYLLIGLARVDLAAHQRFTIPWLFAVTCVMTLACILLGVFPV